MSRLGLSLLLVACSKSSTPTTLPPGTLEPDKPAGTCKDLPSQLVATAVVDEIDKDGVPFSIIRIVPKDALPQLRYITDDVTMGIGISFELRMVNGEPSGVHFDGNKVDVKVKKNEGVEKGEFTLKGSCDEAFRMTVGVAWPAKLELQAPLAITIATEKRH